MRTSRILSSARARFLATVATVFALIAIGGVTAAPASAEVNAYVRVYNGVDGSLWAYANFTLHGPGFTTDETTNDTGDFHATSLPDGDYYVTSTDPTYAPSAVFAMSGFDPRTITIDRYKVTGSIPADAGATTAQIEQFGGSVWTPVTAPVSVSGSFEYRLPNGPADYRIRFQPSVASPYAETVTEGFSIGSVASHPLGAVPFNLARSISGTVYATDAVTPVVGATVHASIGGVDSATATTDATGAYRIGLGGADGDYTVWAESFNFVDQEWDAATPSAETVSLNSTAGYTRTGIDFALVGELVQISGTVLNKNLISEVTVELYSGGTASPTLIAASAVNPDGTYSFTGVAVPRQYFLKFTPSGTNAFVASLLGDANVTEWAKDSDTDSAFSVANSFTVDTSVPASLINHNITMEAGAVLRGTLTSFGTPIDGCVTATDVADSSFTICAEPDSAGAWIIRVPAGRTFTLHAAGLLDEYVGQWWENAASEPSATEIEVLTNGHYGQYNFSLQKSPAKLYGLVNDVASTDPITVHLYMYRFGEWFEADEKDTSSGEVLFWENLSDPVVGLVRGDYRMRFEDSAGNWLAATTYGTGLSTPPGTPVTGPACYIDFEDVQMGGASFIQANVDSSQTSDCGPQPLNYGDVSGRLVTPPAYSPDQANDHAVFLYGGEYPEYADTEADGSFNFASVENGTYTLVAGPQDHVLGEHEYGYEQTLVLTGGNVELGDLVTTRYGNAYGNITNWDDATMGGAVATVYQKTTDGDGDHWVPGPVDVEISSTGYFEVPGIDADGEFAVLVTFDSDYAPVFLGGGFPTPTNPFTGAAEQDYNFNSDVQLVDLVTISGTAFFGDQPLLAGIILAYPIGADDGMPFYGMVDSDGTYVVEVAPNVDYWVAAGDAAFSELLLQFYDGHNYDVDLGCPCSFDFEGPYTYETVEVNSTGVTDINFSLVITDEVLFDLNPWDAATSAWLDDVDIHLYKSISGSWVDLGTISTDAWDYLVATGDGDYRVRFAQNGDWLAIELVESEIFYPYADEIVGEVTLAPARCYYEFSNVAQGSYVWADFELRAGVACTETVAPPATTGSTPTKKKPQWTFDTAGTVETETETEAEPTATPTPTPEPSGEAAGGSEEVVDDKPATTSAPDFAWLFWLCGVLAVLILASGYLIFRRRS